MAQDQEKVRQEWGPEAQAPLCPQQCDLTTALQPHCSVSAGEMQPGLRNAALAWTPVGAGGWLCWQEVTKERCQAEQAAEWGTTAFWATIVERGLCEALMRSCHHCPHPKLTAAPY